MTIEESLTQYQKKIIEEKKKLNFEEQLIKSKTCEERLFFLFLFKKHLDVFVTELNDNGVFFYGFNIIMPFLEKEKQDSDLWYIIHLQVENWINFFKTEVELVEFVYISIVKNSDSDVPYLKGILGVRSLIGFNNYHYNQMKKLFNFSHLQFSMQQFHNCIEINNYWNSIIADNNLRFHRFTQYSRYFELFYGSISDLELQYDKVDNVAFGLDETPDAKFSYIKGIADCNPDYQTIINYLVTIYMLEENLVLYKNILYKKIDLNNIKYFDTVDYLRQNNIVIFEKLKQLFPQQLNGLKIPKLFNRGWNLFFEDIKKNNHYLPSLINFDNFNLYI